MTSRRFLVLGVVIAACSKPRPSLAETLPAKVGEWTRGAVEPLQDRPAAASALGVEEAVRTTYTGPAAINVDAFRMRSETNAFELLQRWRQQDGAAVYKGPYFFVARAGEADARATVSFLAELRRAVTP